MHITKEHDLVILACRCLTKGPTGSTEGRVGIRVRFGCRSLKMSALVRFLSHQCALVPMSYGLGAS
jgi:hypothetical protein